MDQNVSIRSGLASIKSILSHKIYNGIVYYEVECLVDNSFIVKFLKRSDFVNEKNGFEAMDEYINKSLTLADKLALFIFDPLLVLVVD